MSDAIKKGLLEGGRVVVLAIISYLLTAGVLNAIVVATLGQNIDASIQVVIIGLITSVLRAIDKFLHEVAKAQGGVDTGILGTKGLTGF